MKTTDLLTPFSAEWVEKLDRAALQAKSLYSVWERECEHQDDWDRWGSPTRREMAG